MLGLEGPARNLGSYRMREKTNALKAVWSFWTRLGIGLKTLNWLIVTLIFCVVIKLIIRRRFEEGSK